MALKDWSVTPANNASAGSVNWAEGQAPSTVNNSARQAMADFRIWYNNYEWRDFGDVPTYATATSFTITGNVTGVYVVGRRLQLTDNSASLYATIASSVYSAPNTTITVTLDSGTLDTLLTNVACGPLMTNIPFIVTLAANLGPGTIANGATATTQAINDNSTKVATTAYADRNVSATGTPTVTCTQSGGVLTFTLIAPRLITTQAGNGSTATYNIGANLSIAVPAAASLGATSGVKTRLAFAYSGANNSLMVTNLYGGLNVDETDGLSPTVIGSGSTSISTWYSASGTTASNYKLVGFVDAIWNSGTGWATPSLVESASSASYANCAVGSIGVLQSYQDVTSNRAIGVTYSNNTSRPIFISVELSAAAGSIARMTINGTVINETGSPSLNNQVPIFAIVPVGGTYSISQQAGTISIVRWLELK